MNKLVFDRISSKAQETKQIPEQTYQTMDIFGIVGIIKKSQKSYILYISKANQISYSDIYLIEKVDYLPLDPISPELNIDLDDIFKCGYYFSYNFDISLNTQQKHLNQNTNLFWWNQFVIKQFPESYQLRIVQGFVGSMYNDNVHYLLISRKCVYMNNTIMHNTGVDTNGYAANFIETEQIFQYESFKASFVMVRGSVPVYWEKPILARNIILLGDSLEGFRKHFQKLLENYKKVACINLLSIYTPDEIELSNQYEKLIQKCKMDKVAYKHFDYDEIRNESEYNIMKLNQIIDYFGYFYCKQGDMKLQNGVFRINCYDCIQKSNEYMLELKTYLIQFEYREAVERYGSSIQFNLLKVVYIPIYKTVQNDKLKMIYSYLEILEQEEEQQNNLKLFLPLSISKINENQNYLNFLLSKKESQFTKKQDVSIWTITWNLNAQLPKSPDFLFQPPEIPDIIIIALQEVVQLNAVNVVGNNNLEQVELWRSLIELSIQINIGQYTQIAQTNMVGCLLFVFVKKDHQSKITQIETDTVKCGFGQQLGNKGAVVNNYQFIQFQYNYQIAKFKFLDSPICIINCHLPAGQKKIEARLIAIDDIHVKTRDNYDWMIFTGDTNFRVEMPYFAALQTIARYREEESEEAKLEILQTMQKHDQLNNEKQRSQDLANYYEGNITFSPTYKFDLGSDYYDTSKKQRVPSWTDRVLFRSKIMKFEPKFYQQLDDPQKMSDHRPVGCLIESSVQEVEKEKREIVFRELVNQLSDIKQTKTIRARTLNFGLQNQQKLQKRKRDVDLESITHPYI